MANHPSEEDNFQQLLGRSTEIFRALSRMVAAPTRDLELIRGLVAEGQAVAEEIQLAVAAKQANGRLLPKPANLSSSRSSLLDLPPLQE